MLEYIRNNIIKQTERVIPVLKRKDAVALSELSNRTIHSASVYQDQSSLVFAITVYSLSKIIIRCEHIKDCQSFIDKAVKGLEDCKKLLESDDIQNYKKRRDLLLKSIGNIDKKFRFYVEEVIRRAKIKKGSSIYEHGVSLERTADLLGISQWELMDYIGKTRLTNYKEPAVKIKDRLSFARKIFNMKV